MSRGRPRLSQSQKDQRRRARDALRSPPSTEPPRESEPLTAGSQLVPVLRSEGQRMLLHVTGSLAAIANEIGARSPQSVLDWRNGKRSPAIEARAAMQAAFGIPIEAWTRLPHTLDAANDSMPAAPPLMNDPNAPLPSTLDSCIRLLLTIQRDSVAPGLLPGERVKLVDAEARILKLRADLEQRAELSEDRYVRDHPAWLRCKKALAQALLPFPEAARAVADALDRLEL